MAWRVVVSIASLAWAGALPSASAAGSTPLERLRTGPFRLYYTDSGPFSLSHEGTPLLDGMYFYTAVKSEEGGIVEGFNFRRDTDGHLTFKKERTDDGYRLTWYNKRHVSTRRSRRADRLAGEATVTLTLAGEELAVRYQAKIEPNPGYGEIGFYVPDDALTGGKTARFVTKSPGRKDTTGTLPPPAPKRNIASGVTDLTMRSDAMACRFTISGQKFAGSHGVQFQDFRANDRYRGCYRFVLSFDTTNGNTFDFSWRLHVSGRRAAKPAAAQSQAATRPDVPVLRPDVTATVRDLPATEGRATADRAVRVAVTAKGQMTVADGDQSIVEGEYFHLFRLRAFRREVASDGGVRRTALVYDTPEGTLTKEAVELPGEVWLAWTVKAKAALRGEIGFYCPEAAFKPPSITYRSVNQSTVDEADDVELGSSYCIVSGGPDDPREFQCGTSRRPDWVLQDFRARGKGYRFVAVPRLAAGDEWRGVFRYVHGGDEPYPTVSSDGARRERGILSTLLPDAMTDGFTIVPTRSAKYTLTGEPLTVRMKYYAVDHKERAVTIRWRLVDMWGRLVREDAVTLASGGRPFAVKPMSVAVDANGAYRLEIAYRCGDVARTRELVFAVLPKVPDTGYRPQSVFGAAIGYGDYLGTLAKRIGLKWNRCHCAIGDTQAGYVLPERGQYTWKQVERAIPFHRKHQLFGCHSISEGWKAKWLSDLWKTGPFEDYLKAFVEEYVKPLARRFKGRITCWEVTNEPYYQFKDCPEKWVQLMKATYQALKEIDPGCLVVGTCGPPGSMGYSWYRRTFALGSLDYQDAVSSHLYHFGPWVGSAPAMTVRKWMGEIRGVMKEHGKVVPLWNSETTVTPPASMYHHPSHCRYVRYHPGEKPSDPVEQAQTYFKMLVVHKIEDVKYSFHIFHGGVEYTSHTGEYDETPLAFLATQAALAKHLETAEYLGDVTLHKDVFACLLRDGKRLILIPWGPMFLKRDRALVTLPLPAARFAARDVFDNPVSVSGDDNETQLAVTWQAFFLFADDMPAEELRAALAKASVRVHFADEAGQSVKGRFGGDGAGPAKRSHWVGFHAVDLTGTVNRGFRDETAADGKGGWTDEGSNDMRFLPPGEWLINDVPFRIIDPDENDGKSCIVLKGGMEPDPPVPERVTIPVGRRISKLHFLHTVTWGTRSGPAFRYVLHYKDGYREDVPVEMGRNVADWWWLGEPPEAKLAWEGPNPDHEKVHLWHATHEIAHPKGAQAVLERIEIVSECKRPVPVIIAITGVYSN